MSVLEFALIAGIIGSILACMNSQLESGLQATTGQQDPTDQNEVVLKKTFDKADGAENQKLKGLLHNEDCTDFFAHQNFPPGKAGKIVDRYVDVLADAGVTVLMLNTNARRTNYRSKVWESFWDGYDPKGTDDQSYFAVVPTEQRESYRKLIGNMLATHNEGVDYPARVIQRCRHHGISPWISLRMNDVHFNDNLDHPFHSSIWRKPKLFRQGHPGYFARALDYSHPEVRDHYRALIVETLERYDIEGLRIKMGSGPILFGTVYAIFLNVSRTGLFCWFFDVRGL